MADFNTAECGKMGRKVCWIKYKSVVVTPKVTARCSRPSLRVYYLAVNATTRNTLVVIPELNSI